MNEIKETTIIILPLFLFFLLSLLEVWFFTTPYFALYFPIFLLVIRLIYVLCKDRSLDSFFDF
jgi:hypothetical protein